MSDISINVLWYVALLKYMKDIQTLTDLSYSWNRVGCFTSLLDNYCSFMLHPKLQQMTVIFKISSNVAFGSQVNELYICISERI